MVQTIRAPSTTVTVSPEIVAPMQTQAAAVYPLGPPDAEST